MNSLRHTSSLNEICLLFSKGNALDKISQMEGEIVPVVQVEHLRKVYGPVVAVDDVSFEVQEGEIFGMVGHVLPLTYVVQLLQELWFAEPWGEYLLKVAVLFGMLIVGVVVSAKTFRWE